ncbi:hypothetical protein [uncultured Subdoligranulum sp.]|uniref:hypothetical protein n=1 Tax=uncultured Subdoligranulum sp. TaxID=512298 RepID=UPI00320A761C
MYTGFFSNRNKRLVWALGAVAAFELTGCTDRKKPYNFLNSVWVCEEARACIAVTKRESRSYSYGEIELNGKVLPITMVYFNGTQGALLDFSKAYSSETIFTPQIEPDKYLWRGYIAYTTTDFTLEKTFEDGFKYPLFSDDDLPLTFVRYDRTEEELLPLLAWDTEGNLREDFEPGELLELGLDVYAQDPPEEKADGFNLSDFWPDPFGVSNQKAPGAAASDS